MIACYERNVLISTSQGTLKLSKRTWESSEEIEYSISLPGVEIILPDDDMRCLVNAFHSLT